MILDKIYTRYKNLMFKNTLINIDKITLTNLSNYENISLYQRNKEANKSLRVRFKTLQVDRKFDYSQEGLKQAAQFYNKIVLYIYQVTYNLYAIKESIKKELVELTTSQNVSFFIDKDLLNFVTTNIFTDKQNRNWLFSCNDKRNPQKGYFISRCNSSIEQMLFKRQKLMLHRYLCGLLWFDQDLKVTHKDGNTRNNSLSNLTICLNKDINKKHNQSTDFIKKEKTNLYGITTRKYKNLINYKVHLRFHLYNHLSEKKPIDITVSLKDKEKDLYTAALIVNHCINQYKLKHEKISIPKKYQSIDITSYIDKITKKVNHDLKKK